MSGFLLNPYISFGEGVAFEGAAAAQILLTADAQGEHDNSDPHFGSVLALLNFQTSITFNDAPSGFTINNSGLVLTTGSGGKFGEGVQQTVAGTGVLSGVNTDNWDFTTVDFTVECWVYRENAVSAALLSHWRNASSQQAWWLGFDASGHLEVNFNAPVSTPLAITAAGVTPNNAWSHVVFERATTTFRLYQDGAMVGTKITGNSSSLAAVTNAADDFLRIGLLSGGAQAFFDDDFPNRRMDEIRITRGVARYNNDAGYTVPTGPFPTA